MADYYMVEKVLYKIKEVLDIEKFNGSIILINRNDRLSKDITLKRVAILMTCVIRNGNKFIHRCFWITHYVMNMHTAKHLKKT